MEQPGIEPTAVLVVCLVVVGMDWDLKIQILVVQLAFVVIDFAGSQDAA